MKEIFVRYPQPVDADDAQLCLAIDETPERDGGGSAGEDVIRTMREYQRTENPVYLLMAFIIATDAELYPPQGILRWLRDGFRK